MDRYVLTGTLLHGYTVRFQFTNTTFCQPGGTIIVSDEQSVPGSSETRQRRILKKNTRPLLKARHLYPSILYVVQSCASVANLPRVATYNA